MAQQASVETSPQNLNLIPGQFMEFTFSVGGEGSVTGWNLTYSIPADLLGLSYVRPDWGGTHDEKMRQITASGVTGISEFAGAVAAFVGVVAIAAGTDSIEVSGTVTTTTGIFNVDFEFPITISSLPTDPVLIPEPLPPPEPAVPVPPPEPLPIPAEDVVSIPDANLAAAVRKTLGLRANAPITQQAMQNLTELDARNSKIKSLTGLEHATRLRLLEVRQNQIHDIRPLAKLKSLKKLILEQNAVRDISPVANMTQLTWLLIGGNPVSDFTPLANLNQLEGLGLWGGNIGDVTLLANKTKLTHLWLGGNNITNIAPLANLRELKVLELQDNQIRNINPLIGMKKLEELSVRGNPIQDMSPLRTLLKQNPKLKLDIHLDAGPKIEGPWVWMIAPTGEKGPKAASSGKDWLAAASGGSVTEQHIATNGARAGDAVGNKVWTSGKIAPTGGNNLAEMVNTIGLGNGDYIEYHVAYGSVSLRFTSKTKHKDVCRE